MNKVVKSTVVYVLVAIVGLFLLAKALTASPGREKLDTLAFTRLIEAQQVESAKLYDRDHVIKGELKDGKKFEVKFPDRYTDELTDTVVKAGVNLPVDNQKESLWVTLLFNFAPFILIIGVIAFFMNQAQGGGNRVMSFGKARPKIVNKDTPTVTFVDVAGVDERSRNSPRSATSWRTPKFHQMGAKSPRASCSTVRPEPARPCWPGPSRVRRACRSSPCRHLRLRRDVRRRRRLPGPDLFQQAKNSTPAIVFIDEMDAVGRQRGAGVGGGHDEAGTDPQPDASSRWTDSTSARASSSWPPPTGPTSSTRRCCARVASTARSWSTGPTSAGRRTSCAVHAKGRPLAPRRSTSGCLPRGPPGFTGADLANLLERGRPAGRPHRARDLSTRTTLERGRRPSGGRPGAPEPGPLREETPCIAYHEGGHAL